jgi:AcrR family transcriptional regulator
MASDVKIRRYDATGRRAQAMQTRQAVLRAAERQFVTAGYSTATIASIAAEAGVSVDTIYKGFGGKPGLVREIYKRGLEGRGDERAYDRSDAMREREQDPVAIMREWGKLTAEVALVASPIRILMRNLYPTEPEIAAVLDEAEVEHLDRMRHHARFLKARGYLRAGVSVAEATDVLWLCSSVELYELLCMRRGWSQTRFARYVSDLMIRSLLD